MANNFVVIGSEAVSVAPDNVGVAHNVVCRPRGHVTITPSLASLARARLSFCGSAKCIQSVSNES